MITLDIFDYTVEIQKISDDEGGGYIATIPELGCIADGSTTDEAIDELREIAQDLVTLAKKDGRKIPEPKNKKEEATYSGRLTLRIPKMLHRKVAKQAEIEDCSINQLITTYISIGIGNEFGKKKLSINVDTNLRSFEGMVKPLWDDYNSSQHNRISEINLNEILSKDTMNLSESF